MTKRELEKAKKVGNFNDSLPNNIFMKNLRMDVTSEELKEKFAKYGELGSIVIKTPESVTSKPEIDTRKKINVPTRFAFVCYKDS